MRRIFITLVKSISYIFLLYIFLINVSLAQPVISVIPDSLNENLFTGQNSNQTLTISNNGTSQLDFSLFLNYSNKGYALQFDGLDDYVETSMTNLVNQFQITVEVWIKVGPNYAGDRALVSKYHHNQSGNLDDSFYLGIENGLVRWQINSGNSFNILTGNLYITAGNWYHITGTWDGMNQIIYINGNARNSTYYTGVGPINNTAEPVSIGKSINGGVPNWFFNGTIDEVRIWNISRTQTEIQANMNQELSGTEAGLIGYWKFNEGNGNVTFDQTLNGNHGILHNNVTWDTSAAPVLDNSNWLTLNPDSGNIAAGASEYITVNFHATRLFGGNYDAEISITNNDPNNPEVTVPVHLFVTDAPDIQVSDDTLNFGGIFMGDTATAVLNIVNFGTDILVVNNITSNNNHYTVDVYNFSLNPFQSQEIVVTFTTTILGSFPGILTIFSNDPDEPNVSISLLGEGVISPDISVAPDSFSQDLLSGKSANHTLTINNTGGSNLDFEIWFKSEGDTLAKRKENFSQGYSIDDSNSALENLEHFNFSDYEYNNGYSPLREEIYPDEIKLKNKNFNDLKILLLTSGGYPWEIQSLIRSYPNISIVDVYDARLSTPTLNELLEYHSVIVMNNLTFNNPISIGDVLADFVDLGGGLILTNATFVSGWEIRGRLLNEGYIPFNIGHGPIGYSTLGNFSVSHPIMQRVSTAEADVLAYVTVANDAELIAEWSSGFPFVATKGLSVVAVNIFVAEGGYWTGDIPLILCNAINWSTGWIYWLYSDFSSGTIAAGSAKDLTITFDASGLSGGDYAGNIYITSNDPDESKIKLPARLQVTDAPSIVVESDTINFGQVFIGDSLKLEFLVENNGSQDLLIFNITAQPAQYAVFPSFASINPRDIEIFTVTFSPPTVGNFTGTLTFTSNDPVYSSYEVVLVGRGVKPPQIFVSPLSINAAIMPGQTSSKTLTISNVGFSELIFDISKGPGSDNYALQFDGMDDYVKIPDHNSLNMANSSVSISVWIKSSANYSDEKMIIEHDIWDNPGTYQLTSMNSNNIRFNFPSMYMNEGALDYFINFTDSNWHHVVGMLDTDNNEAKIYYDGNLVANITVFSEIGTATASTYIGSRGGNELFFDGLIDEVRIWNISRTQTEIQADMYRKLSGTEPGLVGYWGFNGATGDTAFDQTTNQNHGIVHGGATWISSTAPISPDWLTFNPDSAICLPDSSKDILVTFDATELDTGDYYSSLIITSNDPASSEITVPIHLLVSDTISNINQFVDNIPKTFSLKQNYPNPFNPITTIEFELPKSEFVTLKVYNILGQEVTTLVSKKLQAGKYKYTWDASTFASGIYYYRIQAGTFIKTRKLILMK